MKYNSITKLFIGLIFTFLNISFFNINLYTQIIGSIFLIAGAFQLRKEDIVFKYAYIVARISFVIILLYTFFCAIGYNIGFEIQTIYLVVNSLINIIFAIFLFTGLAKLAFKTNQKIFAAKFRRNTYIYAIAVLLFLITYFVPFLKYVTIPLIIILYLLVLGNLFKFRKRVHNKLLNVKERKVSIKLFGGIVVSLILLVTCCFFGLKEANSPTVKSDVLNKNDIEEITKAKSDDIEQIKISLLASGFPEVILNDLPNTELLLYSGVTSVNTTSKTEKNDEGELEITSVVATLPDKNVRFLEYYKWLVTPKNDYIDLIGVSVNKDLFNFADLKISSNHMYDKEVNGRVVTYKKNNLSENNKSTDLARKFRVDNGNINQRGYISFTLKFTGDSQLISEYLSAVLYVHQTKLYNMPYKDIYNFYDANKAESNHTDFVFKRYVLKTTERI